MSIENFQEQKESGMTSEKLKEIRDELRNKWLDNIRQGDKIIEEGAQKLLREKEKFASVFETEKGSLYFVSHDGASFRIKKDDDGISSLQPLVKHLFFIDAKETEKIIAILQRGNLQEDILNVKIKTRGIEEGLHPLEFGVSGDPEVLFLEEGDVIMIQGVRGRNGGMDRKFTSGLHLGNKVTKIYKK